MKNKMSKQMGTETNTRCSGGKSAGTRCYGGKSAGFRLLSALLAAALAFSLLAAAAPSLPAYASGLTAKPNPGITGNPIGPVQDVDKNINDALTSIPKAVEGAFRISEHPVGATYTVGEAAVPLKATFEYDRFAGFGLVFPWESISVQWYWSSTNSNTDRSTPIGAKVTVEYADKISHTATYTPQTGTISVRYYYAVISYSVPDREFFRSEEAVTLPARVEIERRKFSFQANKTDGDGKPLAGAVLELAPVNDDGSAGAKSMYQEATSSASGTATFTDVEEGSYILSEKRAPSGYEATDDEYRINVTANGVYLVDTGNSLAVAYVPGTAYKPVTFVNEKVEEVPEKEPEYSLVVNKEDGDGKPLAGAALALDPTTPPSTGASLGAATSTKSYEATSTASGAATFTNVVPGYYILSEKKAPAGYEAADDKYNIYVGMDGILLYDPETADAEAYKPVTFVNEKVEDEPDPDPDPEPAPAPDAEHSFVANKVDGDGKPLAGAVLALDPAPMPGAGSSSGAAAKSYEATSTAGGVAAFTVEPGFYVLSEKQAPAGFNATDEKHYIFVDADGIQLYDPITNQGSPYAPVTFVNKPIPALDKDNHFAYMQGYPAGDFRPEANMTRAEAVVMFSRLLIKGMDAAGNHRNNYYPDVQAADWFSNQVGFMQAQGVLAG
jgi:hypothetical protein